MTSDVTAVECACVDCVCVVRTEGAVEREGRFPCGDACAEHHKDGAGCRHAGCTCHG